MFFRVYVFQNFQIPTASMENNLLIGDHITANMFMFKNSSNLEKALFPFRDIKRGDVVVFKYPGNEREDWIKRCIGVPGDKFKMIKGRLYLNDEPVEEAYPFFKAYRGEDDRDRNNRYYPLGFHETKPGLANAEDPPESSHDMPQIRRTTINTLRKRYLHLNARDMDKEVIDAVIQRLREGDPERIPEGFYMMMGDNRNFSYDSRSWGLVPRELIQGRAWLIWWSYGESVGSHRLNLREKLGSYLRMPVNFWTRTHWERTFDLIK